jgi:signal peptidase
MITSKLSFIFPLLDSSLFKWYIFPITFTAIIITVGHLPKIHPLIQFKNRDSIYFYALIYSIIFLLIKYIAGFIIYGFGKTPFDLTPRGMWLNFLQMIIPFAAAEVIRSYAICSYCRKKNIILFILITVVMILININYKGISQLKDLESVTIYLSREIGPFVSTQFILSYLVLYGGATTSIMYGGLLLVFQLYCPFQPNLNWLGAGVIGIAVPIFELLFLVNKYEHGKQTRRDNNMSKKEMISSIATFLFSVIIIWFVVGVFPIYPTVIVTGSMKPLISPGDVVVAKQFYKQEEIEALEVGDIILFQRDNIIISHRIIQKLKDDKGNISFQTKGDNNSGADTRIVLVSEVKGEYLTVIPKIGYPSLLLKSGNLEERNDVEY